jgi:hypothetical protein
VITVFSQVTDRPAHSLLTKQKTPLIVFDPGSNGVVRKQGSSRKPFVQQQLTAFSSEDAAIPATSAVTDALYQDIGGGDPGGGGGLEDVISLQPQPSSSSLSRDSQAQLFRPPTLTRCFVGVKGSSSSSRGGRRGSNPHNKKTSEVSSSSWWDDSGSGSGGFNGQISDVAGGSDGFGGSSSSLIALGSPSDAYALASMYRDFADW